MALILKHGNGTISVNEINGKLFHKEFGVYRTLNITDDEAIILNEAYKTNPSPDYVESVLNEVLANRNKAKETTDNDPMVVKTALSNLIRFFSEVKFTPSYRFVNTLCHLCKKSVGEATNYISNYFALIDSPFVEEIANKTKSVEFRNIITALAENVTPTKTINTRLRIYYGAQGTGKTTEAMTHTQTAIVCNSAMQPCDLIEDFTFDDGKAAFHPSALVKAMENGKTVLLDEMNLLPFDSLRFLQGICDGKSTFEWKGNTIHIHDGFNIIGTMNLVVNGTTFGLPEPIVDRCSELREFTLTADMLMGAI